VLLGQYAGNRYAQFSQSVRVLRTRAGGGKTLGTERSARVNEELIQLLVRLRRHVFSFCHRNIEKAN